MPKARSIKKRPCNKRSPAQQEHFARNHAHKPFAPLSNTTNSLLPVPSMSSTPAISVVGLQSHLNQTSEILNKTLTELEKKSNEVYALEHTLEDKQQEIRDLENELLQGEYENQTLRDAQRNADFEIRDLENELLIQEHENDKTHKELASSQRKNDKLSASLLLSENQLKNNYTLLRNERRKTSRSNTTAKASQAVIHLHDLDLQATAVASAHLKETNRRLEETIAALAATNGAEKEKTCRLQNQCEELRQKVRKLQMRCLRIPTVKSNAARRAKATVSVFKLTTRGKYSPEARTLARKLTKHGCSQEFVGVVIEDVCKAAGVRVNRRMSRRTVGRAIGEGGLASKIQIIDEMAHAASAFQYPFLAGGWWAN